MVANASVFYFQAAISSTVICFSIAMLVTGHDPGVYLPIVTSIVGYWLPAPSLPKTISPEANIV